ncbi:hypothetical protein J2X36_005208 [Methylobacterium sp. BE186]|nr:hypothetical protein [Methylobacterium sp. BE186]
MTEDLEYSRTVWITDVALGAIFTSVFLAACTMLILGY